MTDTPKVVGLDGKPLKPVTLTYSGTPEGIVRILEQFLDIARTGNYKALAVILIDKDAQPLCAGMQSPGPYFNALVGGLEVMKHRVLTEVQGAAPTNPERPKEGN